MSSTARSEGEEPGAVPGGDTPAAGAPGPAPGRFVIAGAGLLGRLLAWRLLRAGHPVTLLDRDAVDGEGGAGRVAAAMLAPYSEAARSERAVFEAGLKALSLWPEWLRQLAEDDPDGGRVEHQLRGSVVVAHRNDAASLQHFEQNLRARLMDRGDRIQSLNAAGLGELEPELVPTFSGGLYLPDEGCLDNWSLLDALGRAIPALGGEWLSGVEIAAVRPGQVIAADGGRFCGEVAVDTRGFGAKRDWSGLRGVRGEVLWVRAPEVGISRPVRLMHPRYQLYIAPRPDHVYVIGATEIESESCVPITVRSGLELQSALYSVHTGFAEACVLKAYASIRPAFPDNLPRARLARGHWQLNGLYRHGYLLGPVLVSAVMASARDGASHPWVERVATGARGVAQA